LADFFSHEAIFGKNGAHPSKIDLKKTLLVNFHTPPPSLTPLEDPKAATTLCPNVPDLVVNVRLIRKKSQTVVFIQDDRPNTLGFFIICKHEGGRSIVDEDGTYH
jgi:hypothetical protein